MNRTNLSVALGVLLIAVAVLLSGHLLESTIFPAGTIVGTSRRAMALNGGRMLVFVAGLYFVLRRPNVTSIHLAAFATIASIVLVLAGLCLQVVLVLPPLTSGWKSEVAAAEQNQLGYRGRKIQYAPDDFVVVLLGDSQVEASALPFEAIPERRLEHYLGIPRVKVFSVGTGGYGQDQELLALLEYFATHRADLVVLWETPGNDVWNNVFKTHMFNRNPKPTYWLDGHGQFQGPSEMLGQPLATSRIVVASLFKRAFLLPWRDVSWERRLPEPYKPMTAYSGAVRSEWQERWNRNIGRMRDENLETEKNHFSTMLTPRSERTQYGLDLTHALLQRIDDLVQAHRGQLMIFQTGTEESAPDGEAVYALNGKYYRVSRQQFDANWSYVNRGFATDVIPVTVSNWRVGPEDGHLNLAATDQAMADLAERLRDRVARKSVD